MAGYRTQLSPGRDVGADDVLFLHVGGAPCLLTAAVEGLPSPIANAPYQASPSPSRARVYATCYI
ncbi:MAG: hypothetical protein ACRD50_17660 [Candidatus Acidiferrales bacterium]